VTDEQVILEMENIHIGNGSIVWQFSTWYWISIFFKVSHQS